MARPLTKLALIAALALLACGYARSEHVTFSYSYSLATITSIPEHGTTVPGPPITSLTGRLSSGGRPIPWR